MLCYPNEETVVLQILPKVSILLEEIVLLLRLSDRSSDSNKTDSEEVDIDCSEREQRLSLSSRPIIKTKEVPLVSETNPDVSECESQSETDAKLLKNSIPQQQQPVFELPAPEVERLAQTFISLNVFFSVMFPPVL